MALKANSPPRCYGHELKLFSFQFCRAGEVSKLRKDCSCKDIAKKKKKKKNLAERETTLGRMSSKVVNTIIGERDLPVTSEKLTSTYKATPGHYDIQKKHKPWRRKMEYILPNCEKTQLVATYSLRLKIMVTFSSQDELTKAT